MRVGFGFSNVTFRPSRVFYSRIFSRPSVDTHEQSTGNTRIFTKPSKCCDKFLVLTMSLYAFISLLYKQLLQYTLLKSFTVPSVLLTKFPKKFHAKLLASAFIFTKLSTKTLCFDAAFWVSKAMQKDARILLTAFCQCSSFVVNDITEI